MIDILLILIFESSGSGQYQPSEYLPSGILFNIQGVLGLILKTAINIKNKITQPVMCRQISQLLK
jgi:hypothetical protein